MGLMVWVLSLVLANTRICHFPPSCKIGLFSINQPVMTIDEERALA